MRRNKSPFIRFKKLFGIIYYIAICGYKDTIDSSEDIYSEIQPSFVELNRQFLLTKITSAPTSGEAFWGANWNKLYRKKHLPNPFQRNFLRCQDYDSNLRFFFSLDNAILVDSALYYWRSHPLQSTKAQQYDQIRNECRTKIFLGALSEISKKHPDYRPPLLTSLYIRLALWNDSVFGTEHARISRKMILQAEKKTLFPFLFCRRIPLAVKVHLLFALHCPRSRKGIHSILDRVHTVFT